jgi:predicted DNA-binding transcriptional regulator AlpA
MQEQDLFNERYIAAPEIMEFLGVSRTSLLQARRAGRLPTPIVIPNAPNSPSVWVRSVVEPILKAWKEELQARRERNHD